MLIIDKKEKKYKKGTVIYFAILVMSVLFGIGMGLSVIVTNQIKMTREIGNSVFAFFAAETGIEEGLYVLYKTKKTTNCENSTLPFSCQGTIGNTVYRVKALSPGSFDCPIPTYNYFCLKSEGIYKNTKRALDVSF